MNQDKLVVLWTSGDKEVALKVAFMYTINAKKREWWKEVELVIWGPSANLVSQDKDLQEHIRTMKEIGITVTACKACADSYQVTPILEELGAEVIYMGEPLTHYLKEGHKVLTF